MTHDASSATPRPRRRCGSASRLASTIFALAALTLAGAADARAQSPAEWDAFLKRLWPQAQARGVSDAVLRRTFDGMTPDPEVMEKTRKQAEFSESPGSYVERRVSPKRIETGQAMARQWADALAAIERQYGVPAPVVLSVWGNETNFGGHMGGHNVIRALATLTANGYRREFFARELLTALEILQAGHTSPDNMVGSWAGAMGHTQFMPTSFKAYAVDFTGDGRRDIWTTIPDALASTANYLRRHGWRAGEAWGYEVQVPRGFNYSRGGQKNAMTLAQWEKAGIRRVRAQGYPRPGDKAWLYTPSGANGPAFLLLHNFGVIKRYNNANTYALAVGYLADRIAGFDPVSTPWPADDTGLTQAHREELQTLLASLGFEVGGIDGVIGTQTRAAIQEMQGRLGLPQDGHPSQNLLERLRVAGR